MTLLVLGPLAGFLGSTMILSLHSGPWKTHCEWYKWRGLGMLGVLLFLRGQLHALGKEHNTK